MLTREERGEDVYECMLDQTLNDERSQKSNSINCYTQRKKIIEMDGTLIAFFISQKEIKQINTTDIHISYTRKGQRKLFEI